MKDRDFPNTLLQQSVHISPVHCPQGDGSHRSTAQWTYSGHRRSVTGVTYLAAGQRVASCDQLTLHLWDPFIGVSDGMVELGSITVRAGMEWERERGERGGVDIKGERE